MIEFEKTLTLSGLFLLFTGLAVAQDSLEGTVKDSSGNPIIGASVLVEGTVDFSITDDQGLFLIRTAKEYPLSIRASFVGFKANTARLTVAAISAFDFVLEEDLVLAEVMVTSRRRQEEIQALPIPITVLGRALLEETQAFNVNRLKELVPSLQLYSSNPRNTTLNNRGLGYTFGLTNDGIDPGVGFYVDGVYYARPAVTTLDFIDID